MSTASPRAPVPGPRAGGARRLIGPGEPEPVSVINRAGAAPMLLLCDHAGAAVPRALGRLGLPDEAFGRHIAYDIGAAGVTRLLAERFDAPAVLSAYSRLVIDLNRALDDPTSIPEISDGVVVPANRGLSRADVDLRVDELFRPYHDAVAAEIDRMAAGGVPAVVSVHSFTPVMRGFERPWHVGVLWDRDARMAKPMIAALREDTRLVVGDNEPYTGRDAEGATLDRHCRPRGLPHVLLEIRQDLIATPEGQAEWAERLADPLSRMLGDPAIHHIETF